MALATGTELPEKCKEGSCSSIMNNQVSQKAVFLQLTQELSFSMMGNQMKLASGDINSYEEAEPRQNPAFVFCLLVYSAFHPSCGRKNL